MNFAGLTSRGLAKRLRERGALPRALAGSRQSRLSASAIDFILNGETKSVSRERRQAIAHVCGAPITSAYLGGEEELPIPPLLWPPSAPSSELRMPLLRPPGSTPPLAELVSFVAGHDIAACAEKDWSVGNRFPIPDIQNALRWALDLSFWRESIFNAQEHGDTGSLFRRDADDFAAHVGAALRTLLRPWLEGRVDLRPHALRRFALMLDAVASESVELYTALEGDNLADVAILDELQAWPAAKRDGLRATLESFRDAERQKGTSEVDIMLAIQRGRDAVDATDEEGNGEPNTEEMLRQFDRPI
jgi:transcriptional regulator with XRE-family HTH domain